MKDEECWKKCEYANPQSEIISAYLMKKKENEQLKKHCDELELINQKVMEENEQLKKDIIEIEKLSDSRWEENERLRAELQIKFLSCHL